ncbi:hypothetical protein [uncultured Mediterranean phage]|nr:hypothetical protein [uncultured Mediterranean phage]
MRTIAFLATLFLAAYTVAADGDEYQPREDGRSLYYLCDSKSSADEGNMCTTYQVKKRTAGTNFYVNADTGCTAYTVTIQESPLASGGEWHNLGTLSDTGNTALHVTGFAAKYIRADLTTLTNCTDFDLLLEVNP